MGVIQDLQEWTWLKAFRSPWPRMGPCRWSHAQRWSTAEDRRSRLRREQGKHRCDLGIWKIMNDNGFKHKNLSACCPSEKVSHPQTPQEPW